MYIQLNYSKVILVIILLVHYVSFAQIMPEGNWQPIGNTILDLRFDDADNTDGFNDGALSVDGLDTNGPLGVLFAFNGSMQVGQTYNIETAVYNYKQSYIKYSVQLYNLTDNTILTESPMITIAWDDDSTITTNLTYTAINTDDNDKLELRYVRENTFGSNHVARDFAIDYAHLNGENILHLGEIFFPRPIIDIPAVTPTNTQLAEMDLILAKMSDFMLGTGAPSNSGLLNYIASYDALNIVVNGDVISGDMPTPDWDITVWQSADFLKGFAKHLKYNPTDATVYTNGLTLQEMVNNTIWFFADQFYKRNIPRDGITYFYKKFALPAVFLRSFLSDEVKELFYNTLIAHSNKYIYYWEDTYILGRSGGQGAINIDDIGNMSDIQLVFSLTQNTPTKKLQWIKGFKRYYERFMTETPGTADGIKSDGSSFHHQTGLNNYTYNYNKAISILSILDGTSFQVSPEAYRIFRKGIYTQLFLSNGDMYPLAMAGRHPEARNFTPNKNIIPSLANTGGHILGLSTPDPILAKAYVREWGAHNDLANTTPEIITGFKPLNYHGAGIYWKDNWMASSRGQSNWSFGSEMIRDHQHYGRYQSYGTLEIIYPGGQEAGNGYRFNGWNWNFNPGATSIHLPWNLLRVENKYQKEFQKKGFVGALSLSRKAHEIYDDMGDVGLFAMDFEERESVYGYRPFGPITHDFSFKFKKSIFFFDDYIVALGSNINNDDTTHETVTTLFQRMSENQSGIIVNGSTYTNFEQNTFTGSNWLIDNFNTGYYVVNEGSNQLKIQRENQHIPFLIDFDYTLCELRSPVDYSIGYIDHGTNPINSGYEYVVKPNTSATVMNNFSTNMSSNTTKPYQVIQKNENAHIVHDIVNNTTGYSLFVPNTDLSNDFIVKSNNTPCLIMTKNIDENSMLLSLTNPDMGFFIRSFDPSVAVPVEITLYGVWTMGQTNPNVTIINTTASTTTLLFNTFDGKPIEILLHNNQELNINDGLCIEAESGIITNMITDSFFIETTTSNTGEATYTFNIDIAGAYKIKTTVFGADANSDSFLFHIDNAPEDIWDLNPEAVTNRYNNWIVDEVTKRGNGTFDVPEYDPYLVTLTQGTHTITFKGREPGAKLDEFCFVRQENLGVEAFTNLFQNLSIYPNPSGGVYNINFSSKELGTLEFSIFSLDGRRVKKITFNKYTTQYSGKINLSNLEDGVYIIQLDFKGKKHIAQLIKL